MTKNANGMKQSRIVWRCIRAALPALASGLCACTLVVLDGEEERTESGKEVEVNVHFRCADAGGTKSAMFCGNDSIQDINLYVWQNGDCVFHEFVGAGPFDITLSLLRGSRCSFYAIANCGGRLEPSREDWRSDEHSMASLVVGLQDTSEKRPLPMSGCVSGVVLSRSDTELVLVLERLVSRIAISFTPDVALSGSGIKITGIRLCDAAQTVKPFTDGCRADGESVADGDSGSAEDLEKVNSGKEIEFYAFENCWGDLLPDNSDQKKKIPSEFGELKGPTYIELSCEFADNVLLSGGLTYRIYLGSDATSNFDIVRNSSYRILLNGSKGGLDELSWRIDKDFTYNDYLASFELVKSRHDCEHLYLGEMFTAKITDIDPSVTAFFGGTAEEMCANCILRCLSAGGDELGVDDDPITFVITGVSSDGSLEVEGLCCEALSSGSLWLCRTDGRPVTRVGDGFSVSIPQIVFSSASYARSPASVSSAPEAVINGTAGSVFVYLCDSEGVNLLSDDGKGCGFSSDVFSLQATLDSSDWTYASSANCFKSRLSDIYDEYYDSPEGQPFCSLILEAVNSGANYAVNTDLWNAIASAGGLSAGLKDLRHGFTCGTAFRLGYLPFEVTFYDTAYGGKNIASEYGFTAADEPLFMMVKNPSRLSFKFRHLTLAERGQLSSVTASAGQDGASLCFYNCPDSLSLPTAMYLNYAEADVYATGNSTSVSCKVTAIDGGTVRIGLKRSFPNLINAVGTTETVLSKNLYGYYDSSDSKKFRTGGAICTKSDFATGIDGRLDCSFSEELEDGGAECSYVYSNDYGSVYALFYSADNYVGKTVSSSCPYSAYPDIKPRKLSQLLGNVRKITIAMDNSDTTDPSFTIMGDKKIRYVYALPTLTCAGFCRTHARGTKRDPVDYTTSASDDPSAYFFNYASAGYSESLTGSSIAGLFETIFNTTYTDSYNWYGSKNNWQHHAHPTSLTLDASFIEYGGIRYVYNFARYVPVNLTYANSGYVSEDASPYTVPTSILWQQMHSRFKNRMILLQ